MDEARGKTLDTIGVAALVALWAETIVSIPGLPDMVPTSFGHDGMPQAYGSRFELLLLPAIATVMWAIVWLTLRAGSMNLNLPFTIPEDRLPLIQPLSRQMQRILRVVLLVGFVALQSAIIESAKSDQLVPGFVAIVLTLVVATVALGAWFIRRAWTIAKGAS
jgi:hypothetical protein